MGRIFARIRRELGPDAAILGTRSLLREGADPLIEVMAAATGPGVTSAAGPEGALPLALQRTLIEGGLERVEPGRGVTVGDLEDLAERERADAIAEAAFDAEFRRQEEAPGPATDWFQGFVAAPPAGQGRAGTRPGQARPPAPIPPEAEAPEPLEWAPRPRINGHARPAAPEAARPSTGRPRGAGTVAAGLDNELVAAGFSAVAARMVAEAAGETRDALRALESMLAGRMAAYPAEHRTAIISIQGPPASGRTTALMRMALDCADAGREALLVAADRSRTGGMAQVHAYGEAIGLPVFDAYAPQDVIHVVTRAARGACVFVDVGAGRWDPPPVPGIEHYRYVAVPAHWSAGAVAAQLVAAEAGGPAGAVLTFTDLATDLTPVLSLIVEAGLALAFLSSGRDASTGIGIADAFTLASGVFTTGTRERTNGRLVAAG